MKPTLPLEDAPCVQFSLRGLLLAAALICAFAGCLVILGRAIGPSPLVKASRSGDAAAVTRLLENGAPAYDVTSREPAPLLVAAQAGHLEVVKALVEAGAPLFITDEYDRTPLMLNAEAGHITVVRYLVSKGARTDWVDGKHETAADLAARNGHWELASELSPYYRERLNNNSNASTSGKGKGKRKGDIRQQALHKTQSKRIKKTTPSSQLSVVEFSNPLPPR